VVGERTLYLATYKSVALAEFSRHMKVDRSTGLLSGVLEREIYRLNLTLKATLDLRNPKVCAALARSDAPACFFADKKIPRAIAAFIRGTTTVEAIIVPSIAFPDDMEKWCLVLLLEKLDPDYRSFISDVQEFGRFKVE
jgi:hypothetical protein